MKIFSEELTRCDTSITAYILDKSNRMLSAAVRPAILVFPGGGYFSCTDREAEPIALAYAAEGYHAFVLRYTVGKDVKFADAMEDANTAMAYIHQHAKQWGIDKNRIAVAGFSAGGHLAAMLGTTGTVRPAAMVLGYPCILAETAAALKQILPSAEQYVDGQTPPTFLFSTRDDNVVPIRNTLAFVDALERQGTDFELHIYHKGAHGLSLAKSLTANGQRTMLSPSVANWHEQSVRWLKSIWGDFVADRDAPYYDVEAEGLNLDTPIEYLLADAKACKILAMRVPQLLSMARDNEQTRMMSLRTIHSHTTQLLPEDVLKNVEDDLAAITSGITS